MPFRGPGPEVPPLPAPLPRELFPEEEEEEEEGEEGEEGDSEGSGAQRSQEPLHGESDLT